jgi:hypothetical protein
MNGHVSIDALRRYQQDMASGEEMSAIRAHLQRCGECAFDAADEPFAETSGRGIDGQPHLTYEQLDAVVEGTSTPGDNALVASHCAVCMLCNEELRELRDFRSRLILPSRKPNRQIIAAVSTAVLLAIGAIWLTHEQKAAPVILRDGGRDLSIDGNGQLVGLQGLTLDETHAVSNAVQSARLSMPVALGSLRADRTLEQRGSSDTATPSFMLLAPARAVVVDDRPLFSWTAVDGARYRVAIFDEHYQPVMQSPELADSHWRPESPLARGAAYSWQVSAITPHQTITGPEPPQMEARFRVIDARSNATIHKLLQQQPRSHLALGVAYAHAGAESEAEHELEIVAGENRGSSLAQNLLKSVQAWSR